MQARYRARYRALIKQLHRKPWSIKQLYRSYNWSKSRIKPKPQYQHITITELNQSNVVKLKPSTGPTLFLNQTTIDRSSATVIQIQYCASCTTRTDTAARKEPVQGQQYDIRKQAPRNGKAAYKRDADEDAP